MRGGEKVLEALCEVYPEADIYTHVVDRERISDLLKSRNIYTTFIDKLPWARRFYQKYLPLMPLALEQLDLTEYDLVISSESGPAKGVVTAPSATHICYCHTPMRYVWDMYHDYLNQSGFFIRLLMRPLVHYLKIWDYLSAARVDHFICNSANVASRIRKFYRRDAEVVFPPVAHLDFIPSDETDDYYLMVGQLVAYKRADLAVAAFNQTGKRLVIIGDGEQLSQLRKIAKDNVELLGWQPFDEIRRRYARCKALIFPGVEDFGIVPLEAMASGRPVIAYAKGGALETVKEGVTGLFFHEQSIDSLCAAVEEFERREFEFESADMIAWAGKFSNERFRRQIVRVIEDKLN
jgi:glycosyltransferase involved in cell wall biosynthesis